MSFSVYIEPPDDGDFKAAAQQAKEASPYPLDDAQAELYDVLVDAANLVLGAGVLDGKYGVSVNGHRDANGTSSAGLSLSRRSQ